jgi:hypothetical protein
MSEHVLAAVPLYSHPPQETLQLPDPALVATQHHPAPQADQVRAIDAVFVRRPEEANLAGVFGAWAGTMLLIDLAQEHFHLPPDEPEIKDEDDAEPKED